MTKEKKLGYDSQENATRAVVGAVEGGSRLKKFFSRMKAKVSLWLDAPVALPLESRDPITPEREKIAHLTPEETKCLKKVQSPGIPAASTDSECVGGPWRLNSDAVQERAWNAQSTKGSTRQENGSTAFESVLKPDGYYTNLSVSESRLAHEYRGLSENNTLTNDFLSIRSGDPWNEPPRRDGGGSAAAA